MVQYIPPPDPRLLLPPLLAALPTAFTSTNPPAALLTLLSPILRQRVQLLSHNASPSESWLPLLCWDSQRASRIPRAVRRISVEPHPVSGEIEVRDVGDAQYRRLDEETLHSRFGISEFGLLAIYLWCMGDEHGRNKEWKLAELRCLEDSEDGAQWYGSITEADDGAREGYLRDALSSSRTDTRNGGNPGAQVEPDDDDDDDDDDYWASYDRTPGRTPAKRSPAPVTNPRLQLPAATELEYFARYAAEVQPAMDPHDPEEESRGLSPSTLNGSALAEYSHNSHRFEPVHSASVQPQGHDSAVLTLRLTDQPDYGPDTSQARDNHNDTNGYEDLSHPRPTSPSSSLSGSVDRLEQSAAHQSQAEMGIKQHISTDIKSLYRLARSAGIRRDEFERIVKTELELLSMMDLDD